MAETLYRLVFRGKIVPSQNIGEVKQKLAVLYKTDVSKIERTFFAGKAVVVKKNLDHQAALKLQSTLTKRTGAIFEIAGVSSAIPRKKTQPLLPSQPKPLPDSSDQSMGTPVSSQPSLSQPKSSSASSVQREQSAVQGESQQAIQEESDGGAHFDKKASTEPYVPPVMPGEVEDRIGFGKRFGAWLLDVIAICVIGIPGGFLSSGVLTTRIMQLAGESFEELAPLFIFLGSFAGALIGVVLFGALNWLLEGLTGASIGKRIVKIKIGDAQGTKAGIGKLLLRYFMKQPLYLLLSLLGTFLDIQALDYIALGYAIIWTIGCFFALGKQKQALHDMILRTAVYPKSVLQPLQNEMPEPSPPPSQSGNLADSQRKDIPLKAYKETAEDATMAMRVGFGRRLGALLLDTVMIIMCGVPPGFLAGTFWAQNRLGFAPRQFETTVWGVGGAFAGVFIIGFLYFVFEGLSGASFGKEMLKIKIAKADGTKAHTGRLLLRYGLKSIIYPIAILGGVLGYRAIELPGWGLGAVVFLGCFATLHKRKQALHDLILNTAVYPEAVLPGIPAEQMTRTRRILMEIGSGLGKVVKLLLVLMMVACMIFFMVYILNYLGV